MKTFTHPQETWNAKKCASMAKARPYGGHQGIIAADSSAYPQYGQTKRYNGGKTIQGVWYQAESVPLPIIPSTFEFVKVTSWGTAIKRKSA